MVKKLSYPWNILVDKTYWTISGLYPNSKFKWFKLKKIPKWNIDLYNGKKIKVIFMKNWKSHTRII